LWREFVNPATLWRLSSPQFGRIEIVADVYDRYVFEGATFGDFRSRGPAILIGATELSGGHRFEFRQSTFNALCSDLNAFPVARAVAASSALPLIFSPMTLVSHWDQCPEPRPDRSALPAWLRAPYIHLLDGGLSDNLSSRGPLEFVEQQGGIVSAAKAHGVERVRLMVFIVVNAETRSERSEDLSPDVPGPWRTLQALIDIPINRYSGETAKRLRETAAAWQMQLREAAQMPGSGIAADVEVRVIEVNLRDALTMTGGEDLVSAPTSLALPKELVDRIRRYGFERFRSHPDVQSTIRLVQEVLDSPR
jgi:NTE family protein